MKKLKAILSSLLLSGISALGFTNLGNNTLRSDGSTADVQAAINAAADGYTVIVPNGTYTWGTTVNISGKGLKLQAETVGGVTINGTAAPKINLTKDTTHNVEVSGFVFGSTGTQLIL